MTVDALLPQAMRDRHAEHRRTFFSDPRSRPMGRGGMPLRGLRQNGDEIDLEINLTPIPTVHGVYAVAVIRKRRDAAS